MIRKLKEREIGFSWYFLTIMILIYVFLFFIDYSSFISSLEFFSKILIKILPIFVLVFILMAITEYLITPKIILKHIERKGIRKWIFSIIGGILSTGPIYMWYPLLADLKEKGVSNGLIACFLYNRAIKIPLIPIMFIYFSWKYIFILLSIMIFASVIQGLLINKFYRR